MNVKSNTAIIKITITAFLALAFFVSSALHSEAAGSYGWFAPKVAYVKDNLPGVCDGMASIEFSLVEKNTQSLISNSVSSWTVILRKNDAAMSILETKSFGTEKTSSVICFNPTTDGFQIKVPNSTNYWGYNGPAILPTGSSLALLTMTGKHFKGYLQLESKSNITPFVETVSPNTGFYSGTPTFQVKTNSLTTLYGTNDVKSTTIFVASQTSPNIVYRATSTTPGGIGIKTINVPTLIPNTEEGIFFWSFIQDLNGVTTTKKLTSPAREWTFSNIPTSGSPDVLSFTIDRSAPASIIESMYISSTSPLTLSVKNKISDSLSGLASTTIFVESEGVTVTAQGTFLSGINSSNAVFDFSGAFVVKGKDYTAYAITEDNSGNIETSATFNFMIPLALDVPIITNLSHETTGVPYQYKLKADVNINGSSVTNWGTCWTTTDFGSDPNSFFTTASPGITPVPGVICKNNTSPVKTTDFSIVDSHNNLPNGDTVYYIAYAKNIAGRGVVSSIGSIVIPFDAPVLPIVNYWNPYKVTSNSINPSVNILSTGGATTLNGQGICYFSDAVSRDSFDSSSMIPAVNTFATGCKIWQTLPPYTSYRWEDLKNLLPATQYYFKVFASSTAGYDDDIGATSTLPKMFKFTNFVGNSPKFIVDELDFNEVSNRYNKIVVKVAAVDASSEYELSNTRRTVSFKADLDYGNDGTIDDTISEFSSLTAHFSADSYNDSYSKKITFLNVPLGPLAVTVTVNEPENPLWTPLDSTNRASTVTTILNNPNFTFDDLSSDESSSGSNLVTDPILTMKASPALVRPGQTTTIYYNMENVSEQLKCSIYGSSNFNTGLGKYSFTHNFDSGLSAGFKIEDDIVTGKIFNSQIFKFECIDEAPDPDVSYITTTRVTVVGTAKEI